MIQAFILAVAMFFNVTPNDNYLRLDNNFWTYSYQKDMDDGKRPRIDITYTQRMQFFDEWSQHFILPGDIVYRLGSQHLTPYFNFSRWLGDITNSRYSHCGIAVKVRDKIEIVDCGYGGSQRVPFPVWILDADQGKIAVSRLKKQWTSKVPFAVESANYCYILGVGFDWSLSETSTKVYCSKLVVDCYRAGLIKLVEPTRIGDFPQVRRFPFQLGLIHLFSRIFLEKMLTLNSRVFIVGNEDIGLMSSIYLEKIFEGQLQ